MENKQNRELLVELDSVDIRNGDNLVLSDVSLRLYAGDFIYIVGKVGSGKTSIIKTLIGEIPVRNGVARVRDFDLRRLKNKQIPYLRRQIGVVFQDFQLLMDRTVSENLRFVLQATGWKNRKAIEERICAVLESVGMAKKAHKMPHQLSGGEQQRVVIARALLNSPSIILADEPTGNLDEDTTDEIMELFMKLHKEYGTSIIMVTHNRSLTRKYPAPVLVCENQMCRMCEMPQPSPAETAVPDTERPSDAVSESGADAGAALDEQENDGHDDGHDDGMYCAG